MKSEMEITLTISIPLFIKDINTLEDFCLELARQLVVKVIEALDQWLYENRPGGLKVEGKRRRIISTRIGNIEIWRRLYRRATKSKESRGRFLLDEYLNIQPRRRITHGLLKLVVALATRLSYREVAKVLEEAGYPAISHSTIHKEVRRYGELQQKELEAAREALFGAGQASASQGKQVPVLFLEADGVIINCNGKKTEVKLGVVYEGWEERSNRRKLKNPRVFAGIFEGGEEFWEAFSAELAKVYDLSRTQVVINGDGAAWIQSTAKEYFPRAIVQLDRYHLKRDLRLAVGDKASRDLIALLDKGELKAFVDTLESLEPIIAEEQQNLYSKLVRFCKRYPKHLLDYRQILGQEYRGIKLYGLGVVENMVDKVIANRMKKRGMSWSQAGAGAMIALLVLKKNGRLLKWLSEHPEDDVANPIKKLWEGIRRKGADPAAWLQATLPALRYKTKPWVKVLRGISTAAFTL